MLKEQLIQSNKSVTGTKIFKKRSAGHVTKVTDYVSANSKGSSIKKFGQTITLFFPKTNAASCRYFNLIYICLSTFLQH